MLTKESLEYLAEQTLLSFQSFSAHANSVMPLPKSMELQ